MVINYGGVDLKVIVLKVLSKSPMHGYKLATEVEKIFGNKPSNGALNPLFTKLEKEDFISSYDTVEQGRYKKIYSITDKGKKELERSLSQTRKFLDY